MSDDDLLARLCGPGVDADRGKLAGYATELSWAPPHRKPGRSATSGFRRRIAADQVGRAANGGLRGRRAGGRLKL